MARMQVPVWSKRILRRRTPDVPSAPPGPLFDPGMVGDLPEPARRLLLRAIEPGTPLASSVDLRMRGSLVFTPGGDPVPFVAEQVLSPPVSFLWRARTTSGWARIRGFDRYGEGQGEMLWKLWGIIPVVRGIGSNVTRSAAGRLAMEGVLLPSSLLPGRGAEWSPVDESRARFRMTVGEETVETLVEVDPEGRPLRASAMRWSERAGPSYEPFGVELSGELRSGGYAIPSRVEAGWSLGGEGEFRFFQAEIQGATFR